MQLTVDTSWWTRYRSRANNPDLDPGFVFPQAVPTLNVGQHPAIPRSDDDLTPKDHIQAIANTAGFHFAFIEQGGTSLYPSLAQRVTSVEVLRILLSIGPTETAHFQTWHDKAGNAPPLTDPKDRSLVFPDLNNPPLGGEDFQTNLIMPEPCPFLSRTFPVSIISAHSDNRGRDGGCKGPLRRRSVRRPTPGVLSASPGFGHGGGCSGSWRLTGGSFNRGRKRNVFARPCIYQTCGVFNTAP
jgi:hypothetical protein